MSIGPPCDPNPFASGLNHNFDQDSSGGGLSTQSSNQDENQDRTAPTPAG